MRSAMWFGAVILMPIVVLAGCGSRAVPETAAGDGFGSSAGAAGAQPVAVSGSAVHYFSTAIVHSRDSIGSRIVQRSTDIIRLSGDLNGYILYHPVSEFDLERRTLVNTGSQVFSGSVVGSAPVLLHDDSFRFEVDLASGATTGQVTLSRQSDARDSGGWHQCRLTVTGTGATPQGDNLSSYHGECTRREGRS